MRRLDPMLQREVRVPTESNSGGNGGESGLPSAGGYASGDGGDASSGGDGAQRKRRTAVLVFLLAHSHIWSAIIFLRYQHLYVYCHVCLFVRSDDKATSPQS